VALQASLPLLFARLTPSGRASSGSSAWDWPAQRRTTMPSNLAHEPPGPRLTCGWRNPRAT